MEGSDFPFGLITDVPILKKLMGYCEHHISDNKAQRVHDHIVYINSVIERSRD